MITCIIPFFNEGENVLKIISAIIPIRSISQIICVDDGSTDGISSIIASTFPPIRLLQLEQNQGKSEAIKKAFKFVNNNFILLLDADLIDLRTEEIKQAITAYQKYNTDLLILENKGSNFILDSILRKNIFLSGKRIMKTTDLKDIFKTNPRGYTLEVDINEYMIKNNKKVFWIENSAINPHKKIKLGFISGMYEDIQMEYTIIRHIGLISYVKQMLFFCKNKIQ